MAPISWLDKISGILDNDWYVMGVLLDFSKGFDTANQSIMLKKLERYGICDNSTKWIQDLFANIIQYVAYITIKSSHGKN